MGCDIHAYIDYDEYVYDNKKHVSCIAELHLGRNYELFGLMAGVRCPDLALFSPRGLPENFSWHTKYENELMVLEKESDCDEDHTCSREAAERWVKSGVSKWTNDKHNYVTHPDWHSHSYLYVNELKQVLKKCGNHPELKAIIAMMKALNGDDPLRSRLVFWFDN